jgi:hypothetical protein
MLAPALLAGRCDDFTLDLLTIPGASSATIALNSSSNIVVTVSKHRRRRRCDGHLEPVSQWPQEAGGAIDHAAVVDCRTGQHLADPGPKFRIVIRRTWATRSPPRWGFRTAITCFRETRRQPRAPTADCFVGKTPRPSASNGVSTPVEPARWRRCIRRFRNIPAARHFAPFQSVNDWHLPRGLCPDRLPASDSLF